MPQKHFNVSVEFHGREQSELFDTLHQIQQGILKSPYNFPNTLSRDQRKYIHTCEYWVCARRLNA